LWMVQYYVGEYGLDIRIAALLAACFSLPGGVLRAIGGVLADRWGAHRVTWWVMWVSWVCLFLLSYPQTDFIVNTVNGPRSFHIGLDLYTFTALMAILGVPLALPVFVLGFAATVELARDLLRRLAGARAAPLIVGGALVLLIAVDFAPHRDWQRIATEHREFEALASAVNAEIPAEARLAAGQGFHYAVYLRRPVYSLMHAVRRAGRLDAAEPLIDKYGIDTVMLSPLVPEDRAFVPYFEAHYGPGTPAGLATIWRVRGGMMPLARPLGSE